MDFPSLPLAVTAQVFKLEAGPTRTYMRCPPLLPVWRIRLGVNLKLHKSVGVPRCASNKSGESRRGLAHAAATGSREARAVQVGERDTRIRLGL